MDANQTIECLEGKGIITTERANELKKITNTFRAPSTDALIAALLLSPTPIEVEVPPFPEPTPDILTGVPVYSHVVTSNNDSDIKNILQGGVTIPVGATKAILTPHGNNIIYSISGTPTGYAGHFAAQGSNFVIYLDQFNSFRFHTETSGSAAEVYVSFY